MVVEGFDVAAGVEEALGWFGGGGGGGGAAGGASGGRDGCRAR